MEAHSISARSTLIHINQLLLVQDANWWKRSSAENKAVTGRGCLASIYTDYPGLYGFPVAQMVEHCASNAKIMGSIPRDSKSW